MTLVNALVGVGAGMAGLFALTSVFQLSDTAPTLALMIGLAVGIDYSLFITSRYRQLLARRRGRPRGRGPRGGYGRVRRGLRGRHRGHRPGGPVGGGHPVPDRHGPGRRRHGRDRRAGRVDPAPGVPRLHRPPRPAPRQPRRPRAPARRASASAGAGSSPGCASRSCSSASSRLGALALPVTHMRLALPDAGSQSRRLGERRAYDLISEGFGPGFNGRLIAVVATASESAATAAAGQADGDHQEHPGRRRRRARASTTPTGTTALLPIFPGPGPPAPPPRTPSTPSAHRVATRSPEPTSP